jgi:hypothetical protein
MLRGLGLVAAGAALSACGGTPAPTQTPVKVVETKVVEKQVTQVVEKQVTQVVERVVTATPAPQAIPKVYVFANNGYTQFHVEGSEPAKLKQVTDYIKQKVGVEPIGIMAPTGTGGTEKLNLLLSSGSQELDTFVTGDDWAQYKLAIQPVTTLLDKYGPNIKKGALWPKEVWQGLKDSEGNIWGWPRGGGLINTEPWWVRKDMLDKVGLPIPKTLEEVDAAMEAIRKVNPNAKMCLAAVQSNVRRGLVGAFTEYGESNWLDKTDNKIKPPDLQPGFVDYLAKVNDWVKKGWVYEEWIDNGGKPIELLRTGNVAMLTGWYSSITLGVPQIKEAGKDQKWEMALGLKGPKGFCQTYYPRNALHALTRKAKNPEAVVKFVDWLYADVENLLTTTFGLKDTDWGWKWKDRATNTATTNATGGYWGELLPAWGTGLQAQFMPDDPDNLWHNQWIAKWYFVYGNGKTPFDYGVPYDPIALRSAIPTIGDLDRLRQEEVVKFCLGKRPLSEFSAYIAQLEKSGLKSWIDAYTKQYNDYKPK